MTSGSFATAFTCMDGRIQRKVTDYLQISFGPRNIDTITTAGLVKHLAKGTNQTTTLMTNLAISIDVHGSRQIAVVAHHDCAGNPVSDKTQKTQMITAMRRLRGDNPNIEITGLWLDKNWIVEKVTAT